MPAVRRRPAVSTLPAYLAEVLRLAESFRARSPNADGPWFRGANNRRHHLLPGAYWREGVHETDVVVQFMSESPPYFEGRPEPRDLWEWYFLMQHYGLPTRLLDWTENALIGLFFALHMQGPSPCVWVLDPVRLNEITSRDARVVTPGGEFSRRWLPIAGEGESIGCVADAPAQFVFAGEAYTNAGPLAIVGARRNARILAQQGTFTIHGADRRPLDDLMRREPHALARIDVRARARTSLLRELEYCGVHEARVFPELERLGPYIKRRLQIVP